MDIFFLNNTYIFSGSGISPICRLNKAFTNHNFSEQYIYFFSIRNFSYLLNQAFTNHNFSEQYIYFLSGKNFSYLLNQAFTNHLHYLSNITIFPLTNYNFSFFFLVLNIFSGFRNLTSYFFSVFFFLFYLQISVI